MKLFYRIILICLIFNKISCYSQKSENKNVLEKQKIETLKQIEFTQKLLENNRRKNEINLTKLNILNRSITARERLIIDLSEEIIEIERNIEGNVEIKNKLEDNIEVLKEEYARIIIAAYRNIGQENYLEYVLGAEDINQGYQRIRQIKDITDYRKKIYEQMIDEIDKIEVINELYKKLLNEKEQILRQKEIELKLLGKEKLEKQNNITYLKSQEQRLNKELKEKISIQKRLEEEIKKLVEEEIRKSKEKNVAILTSEERIISNDFIKNMGGLPWPVNRGIISGQYGEHDHPIIKGIKIKSIGIDINTVEGEKAKAVFNGEVTKIIAIMGANYTVIIKHGEFRTVYQNLIEITVKTGEMVTKGENLGTIYTDENNNTKLHFQVWKDKINLDPEQWLSKSN